MSESFWIAISGILGGCITATIIGTCRACFRFKCSDMEFCGMKFVRNIELENEAQVIEAQNPQPDVIPCRTSFVPPSRRSSFV